MIIYTFYRIEINPLVPEIFNFKDIIYKNGILNIYIYVRVSCERNDSKELLIFMGLRVYIYMAETQHNFVMFCKSNSIVARNKSIYYYTLYCPM